jgi:hypothetical protein
LSDLDRLHRGPDKDPADVRTGVQWPAEHFGKLIGDQKPSIMDAQ